MTALFIENEEGERVFLKNFCSLIFSHKWERKLNVIYL